VKVEKLAKNGEKGQNSQPLSPSIRSNYLCAVVLGFVLLVVSSWSLFKQETNLLKVERGKIRNQQVDRVGLNTGVPIIMWQRGDTLMHASTACENHTSSECDSASFSLDLIKITRKHNPTQDIYLMAEQKALDSHPYYKRSLQKLNVIVINRDNFVGNLSRSAVYTKAHLDQGHHWQPDMMSRFCEISDAVNDLKLSRVFLIDSDVGIFHDIEQIFQAYDEDIVTPCEWCSQVAAYSARALSAFCDAHIEFLTEDRNDALRKSVPEFNDMVMLRLFLRGHWQQEHGLRFAILQEEQPSARNPFPFVWIAATSVQFFDARVPYIWHSKFNLSDLLASPFDFTEVITSTDPRDNPANSHRLHLNVNCERFDELISFKHMAGSNYVVPAYVQSVATLPVIHFQGDCKVQIVHQMYLREYA